MTSKNKKKGKTMGLNEFLSGDANSNPNSKLVTVRATNWSEIMDNEEEEVKPIVVDIGVLPTAPRGSHDVDYSNVPTNPPFVAHIANLSFEIDDESLRRIFADLNPKAARIIKDGNRSRGIGLVELDTRENLIEALKKTDKEVYGRKIRVNVSDKTDLHQSEGGRGTFGNRSNRTGGGEERPEMSSTWKRAEPRSEEKSDDRSNNNFNRDRPYRGDQGRSSTGNNSRNNQEGGDYGFGYPRTRDERGGGNSSGGGRDYNNRQGQRNRYQNDDENRSNSGTDRPRYAGRYSDTRDTRERNQTNDEPRDDQREPPRERQRLQLQPRTKPLEDLQPLSGSSSSINNVAADAGQSRISNADDSSSSIANTSNQQIQDSSINENRDEYQHQDSTDSNARASTTDEQSTVKPTRGAGASIFGGAKPVDTAAKELEIEKKLKELQVTTSEPSDDTEEKKPTPSKSSYNRGGGGSGSERDVYRAKRPSNNDDHRDRRDEGRSNQGGDYHHRQENSGGRQYDDEDRKRTDDNRPRRGGGGGHDKDRYSGPSRRDHDSNRTGKYNHPERDNERGNYRNRNQDSNEFINPSRSSNNTNNTNFNSESQPRHPPRGMARRTVQTEDDSNKLQLSNKFGMLGNDDDVEGDDDNETEEAQSPSVDE